MTQKRCRTHLIHLVAVIFLFLAASARAGISIQYSSSQGWNASSAGTTSLYSSVSVNAGDVVVMSVADNKKNSIALVAGGWSGGTNGVLTDLETSGDTYPASYISYIEVAQAGTYDFWMQCGDPALTAISALYVLRPDSGETAFLADSAEWIDPDNANNGTSYALDYTFAESLTDGVLIEAISARTDLITEPTAYTEDKNGSDKRLLVSFDGVSGNSWTSAYTLAGGTADQQTSSGIGVIFSSAVGGGGGGGDGGTTPSDTIHEWTFDTEADGTSFGGLVDSGSIGGATFASDATGTYVTNDTLRVAASGDGTSAFRNAIVTARTEGKYELIWTVVSGQVTTDGINVGLGFRQSSNNTDLLLVRTHYQTATGFIIQTRMNNANTTLVTLGGTTISSLKYRAVVDLDSDTFDLFYDLGAGEQTAVAGMALAAPDLTLDMIRFAASSKDYGPSDEFFLDDIAMIIPGEPILDPVLSNPTNTVTDGTGDGLALIGETNTVSVVIANIGGGIATNALATLMPAAKPEYFTITTNATPADLATGEQTTNTFTIIARTNAVPGTYTFDIAITADGGFSVSNSVDIEVISGVSVSGQDAMNTFGLVVDTIGQTVTNLSMVISNNTFSPLVCTFADDASWLQDVVPVTVDPRSASNVVLVADSTGLSLGSYTAALSVDYNQPVSASYTNFTVQLDVGAKITFLGQAVTNEVNNGFIPGVYEPLDIIDIVISNFNEGGVSVSNVVNSLSANSSYFTIVPLTATSYPILVTGATTTTAYRVTIASGTPEGSYTFSVTNTGVYAGEVLSWPGSFSLNVVSHASPSVSPVSVSLPVVQGQIATATVTVTNSGNVPFTFTVSDNAAWNVGHTATPGTLGMVSAFTAITLNDPDPGNQFITAETEGISDVLPIGFSFPLYGTEYTNFYVTADGVIGLGNTAVEMGNGDGSLPDGGGNPLIAPFWGSLSSPAGSVRYRLTSTYLVISWIGVDQVSGFGGDDLEFQALLYKNGQVEFRYGSISGNWLDAVTIGIQGGGSYENWTGTPSSGTSVLIAPQEDSWVSYTPTGETVDPFSSVDVVFTADATGRSNGDSVSFDASFAWSSGGTTDVSVSASVIAGTPGYGAISSLSFTGAAGQVTSTQFAITNTGSAALNFSISDSAAASAGAIQTNADYSWINISSIGTDITLIDPDINPFITALDEGTSGLLPIGFSFPFFGGSYTEIAVSANGAIRLDGGTGRVRVMDRLASTDPAMPAQMIAPYWGDLVIDADATLKMHANSERLVITWENVQQYGLQGGSNLTFQLVLRPSGEILFQYKKLEGYPWPTTLIGLRDTSARIVQADIRQPADTTTGTYTYSGQVYTQYVNSVTERTAAFESAQIRVISATPSSGNVPAGGTAVITITGDASNLSAGSNSAVTNTAFTITHNAAGSPASLAVTFTATNSQQTVFSAPDDSDGDGQSDDDERIAGTDPQNSEDVFVVKTKEGRELTWAVADGRTYTVWYTLNLATAFEVLDENLTEGTYIDSVNSTEPVVYYKVTINNL
ncbi:MAG: hypothetical protein JEZ10_07115 [Verrucomicrobia bacterium]|nr:hypothetical protein [Verrucomicrobiota bacterium]